MVLAARAAALRLLIEDGVLDLPSRFQSSSWTGLSGAEYLGSAFRPRQRQVLVGATFRDRTTAVIELADGRRILVNLTGTNNADMDEHAAGATNLATVFIDFTDPELASLAPAELRARLRLLPEVLCWQSHWDDVDLKHEASLDAEAQAKESLDWPVDTDIDLNDIPAELRRETLLHWTVKQILSMAAHIQVPELVVEETAGSGSTRETASTVLVRRQKMTLFNVRLEHRLGNIIPDVCADCVDEDGRDLGVLCIEVTVTHGFDDERLRRVKVAGKPVLEIDLRKVVGRITRTELATVVLDDLQGKRWLHHPLQDACRLEMQRAAESASNEKLKLLLGPSQSSSFERAKPPSSAASGIREYRPLIDLPSPEEDLLRCRRMLAAQPQVPWPNDYFLVDGLVSFRHGVGLGNHAWLTCTQIAHKLRCTVDSQFHALILLALQHYGISGGETDRMVLGEWADRAREQVRARAPMWLTPQAALILQKRMFPELSNAVDRMIEVIRRPTLSVTWTNGELPLDSERQVDALRHHYRDGAYRLYAPKIDYDKVLAEAKLARLNRESLSDRLAIWSAEFALEGDYKPLLTVLRAAGLIT